MQRHEGPNSFLRTHAGVIIYLCGFAALLVMLLHYFWIPALHSLPGSSRIHRHWVGAVSLLLLSVILFYLIAGLILVFRVGRFFFPGPQSPRVRTKVVDAWAEAGRRIVEEPKEE